MVYKCGKCKVEVEVEKECVIYCDDCCIEMISTSTFNISSKMEDEISDIDDRKIATYIARAMKKRFGMQRWMKEYLTIPRMIKTPIDKKLVDLLENK